MAKINTRRRLILISRLLGKVPSLAYATVYLLLIPGFAVIYYYLPNHFYHSTIKYEQILNQDDEVIRQELKKEIIDTFIETHKESKVEIQEWIIDIEQLEVWSLRVEENQVIFSISLSLEPDENEYDENSSPPKLFNAEVEFPLKYIPTSDSEDQAFYEAFVRFIVVREVAESSSPIDRKSRDALVKAIFPYESAWVPSNGKPTMSFQGPLLVHLVHYSEGLNGFPSSLSGNYWRMLYLSAVTITTLGFGDIVPITNTSRILIAAESILGIILIGLFLNALAHERE